MSDFTLQNEIRSFGMLPDRTARHLFFVAGSINLPFGNYHEYHVTPVERILGILK